MIFSSPFLSAPAQCSGKNQKMKSSSAETVALIEILIFAFREQTSSWSFPTSKTLSQHVLVLFKYFSAPHIDEPEVGARWMGVNDELAKSKYNLRSKYGRPARHMNLFLAGGQFRNAFGCQKDVDEPEIQSVCFSGAKVLRNVLENTLVFVKVTNSLYSKPLPIANIGFIYFYEFQRPILLIILPFQVNTPIKTLKSL